MLRWDESVLSQIDAVLAQARAGRPRIVVVEGDAGLGKSSLLEEIVARADGFDHLFAEGVETATSRPYLLLAQLGIDTESGSEMVTATSASQRLRELIERRASSGPVLVVVDDLQWADPESVDALIEVAGRAAGDALLLAVGSRALDPTQLPRWRRWADRPGRVQSIRLTGLSVTDAIELVREIRPGASVDLARALWEHTAGHPVYLRALVSEYDASDLTAMGVLPAPAEFGHTVTARLQRVSPAARIVAEASAVLGPGWTNIRDVGAVAGVSDPASAVQELLDAGLLASRTSVAGDLVRPAHALERSAIHQSTAIVTRRRLHVRAAELVTSPTARLEHRVAATDDYDDELAADLEAYAYTLHDQQAYRQAAHYLNAASTITADVSQRERRWLESLFDLVLSGDRATVRRAVTDVRQASDPVLRDVVLGALAIWERRPFEGLTILTPWVGRQPGAEPASTPLTTYRIEALFAWAAVQAGATESEIGEALRRVAAIDSADPALRRLIRIADGQLAARHADDPDQLPGLAALPASPAATPLELTAVLAWRGSVRSATGRFRPAIADLVEVTERIQRGLHDFSSGAYHAMLAHAYWFDGNWPMARLNCRVAIELAGEYPHPIVHALAPLIDAAAGRFDEADAGLLLARQTIERTPWREAVDLLLVSEVVRQHATGGLKPALDYAPIRDNVTALRAGQTRKSVIWIIHAGLDAIWAGELDDARFFADTVGAARVAWGGGIGGWLHGLAAEAAGDGRTALARLRAAVATDLHEVPLYLAHVHLDHARLALLLGDPTASARSLDAAAEQYQSLGAVAYLDRVNALRAAADQVPDAAGYGLSDRERDVVTLVAAGMSYIQIARALFITRSTVSYHLGNIYAKTNVGSRHELTELAHENPMAFGLGQPA